jgi:predicted transcriptional regulator
MNDFLEKQSQRKIYNLLVKNPGLHLSKIAELLNMPITQVERDLQILVRNRNIIVSSEDGFKRYYSKDDIVGEINNRILETRQKIYDLILKNPGLHQAKIAQILSMRKSLAEYHLQYLEKNQAIISVKDEGYKRYYVEGVDVDRDDRKILSLIRQDIPFKIVSLLLKNPVLKHKEIAIHLRISPSTLSYHLNKLVKQGVIDLCRYGTEKGYIIRNKRVLMKFLLRYEMHTAIDNFKDLWDNIE